MNKRVGKLVLVMIILFFGFLSFQRYTGFVAYSDNITIPETFIQNLDVENVKLYDTNNNGLVDVIEPGKLAKVKIKDTEKQRVIISFNDGSISVMELTEDDINELLKNTNIKSLSLDYKFNLTLQDTIPLINASLVYSIVITNNITGSDSVCILDSGIYSRHAAFKDRIIAKKCYADDDYIGNNNGYCANNTEESDSAEDDLGHGTLVAGIVGASDGITGVAPSSKLVIVKVCNYMGQCQYSDLIKGINYCINNKNNYNISVITLSLGTGYVYSDYSSCNLDNIEITNSINNAFANGIFIDSSSGNSGSNSGISAPACLFNITSVGATDKNDNIAYYSNIGYMLDLLAPGSNINTTSCIGSGSLCDPSGYTNRFSGTSFSSPHVAGSAILLIQYAKEKYNIILNPIEIENILKESGKIINYNNINYSRIDLLSAVNYIDYYLNESLDTWIDLNKEKPYYYLKEYLENITFYANFTTLAENKSCILYFDNNSFNMSINNIFEYSLNINNFTNYNFSVNCTSNKTLSSYGNIFINDFNFYLNHTINISALNLENKSIKNMSLVIYEFNNSNYLYNISFNGSVLLNLTEFVVINSSFFNKTPHELIIYYNNISEERNISINDSISEEFILDVFVNDSEEIITPISAPASSSSGGGGSTKKKTETSAEDEETRVLEQPEEKPETRILEMKKAIEKQITTEEKNYSLYYKGFIFILLISIFSVLYLFFRKKKH
ncbi:MAG: S8 family serine peptidase [Nanoarchaeota archaeon]|nr:S8 family serine peptidase [Nanoarchaeota archaeon]